ncbi:MAG: PQQ-binding-like beta-propeller repeat protein [Planctomycetaceae bacterium]|nr:PQQ-binding-like beta-propeller repeat protein [Planctomycetaceae bacterium]
MQFLRFAALGTLAVAVLPCRGADWSQFRNDAARSGYTSEALPPTLGYFWSHQSRQPPAPAWPTRNRLRFDRANQPIVVNGVLCYGSSGDDKVYALDAVSGQVIWTFFTGSPVRFAPAAWQDRLFVAGDDGHLYCLSVATGKLVWKRRGGPRSDMLLGNDRMISRWPARGGPVVLGDIVYFGAGIWPSEGIFLYALDPRTGDVLWQNDSSGTIEMDQPHATARAKSGISAQGYLAATDNCLLVPTGRAVPAVLNRSDGTLRSFPLQTHQHSGGSDVVIVDQYFANSGSIYSIADGRKIGTVGLQTAVTPDYFIHAVDNTVLAFDRRNLTVERETVDRKGNKRQVTDLAAPIWQVPLTFDAEPPTPLAEELRPPEVRMDSTAWATPTLDGQASALIVAGNTVLVGGRGRLSAMDIPTRELAWSIGVSGTVDGLAVADGRLYVSTDQGFVHCYGDPRNVPPKDSHFVPSVQVPQRGLPVRKAAREIVERTGVADGYCVDLGCAEGGLTLELARRTNLRVYAVDPDPANVQRLCEALDLLGHYGSRVTVHCFDPAEVPYPDYFADLVVSGRSLAEKSDEELLATANRLCRPYGGTLALGAAGEIRVSRRGPLEGAGNWTHQNSSPANTLCSEEQLVRGPLEMLWFRDTDFLLASRHGRAPAALVEDGRMFVEGLNGLRAQSLYNGRVLWEFEAPGILGAYHREHSIGAAWTGGNICLGPGRVYLHNGNVCFVLDAATGRKLAEWKPPAHPGGEPALWGFIACHDGILFGSLAREDYLIKCWSDRWDTGLQFTESTALVALDAVTGKLLWMFEPKHSIRHNAIAIGGGRVYLVDRPVSAEDEIGFVAAPASAEKRRGTAGENEPSETTHPPGRLLALDQKTGQVEWQAEEPAFGTLLIHSAEHDLVWMGYQAAHQASRPSELGNRMAAFRAGSGELVWNVEADYADRPVLNGRTIYAPPGAWDLLTGEKLPFTLQRSYGCGIVSGCRTMLVFRSATLGYLDLGVSPETQNYGGIRPGCWIAAVPAGGVVLMPDAASWCTCSYLNQGTIVLKAATLPLGSRD